MSRTLRRLICTAFVCVLALGSVPGAVFALDTPNTLIDIDAMVLQHAGLFRNATPNDGYNTFQFGSFVVANPITTGYGKYTAFRFQKTVAGDCCISNNARIHSDTPESWSGSDYPIWEGVDISSTYFPALDKAAFGQVFDPSEYQIAVKFKPLLTQATANSLGTNPFPSNPSYPNIPTNLENTAPLFNVGLDVQGGFVFDADAGIYKRAADAVNYNIGSAAVPINTWYAGAPHDSEGYATFTVPVTQASSIQKSYYYNFGNVNTRDNSVVTNGGRSGGVDTTIGLGAGYQPFGGGPSDPSRPGSKLNTPNGVALMSFGAPSAETGLNIEVKSIALSRITPNQIMARIDSNSGITFRFGSALTYGNTQPGIPVESYSLQPAATNQISRFDQNGMTNLFINARTPDAGDAGNMGYQYRFLIRGGPSASTFDGTNAMVDIRARLTQPLTDPNIAQSMTIFAKDLDGNDTAATQGADGYTYALDLHQFNTSTMTTISVPLSTFLRGASAPFGFTNLGDNLLANFNLYEFGGGVLPGGGLLKMELQYMQIRVAPPGVPGDYNNNGIVDAGDYVLWRKNGPLQNEVDTPNTVNAADYTEWRKRFGNTSGSGSSLGNAAVPEPAAWLIVSIGMSFLGVRRLRGK